MNFVHIFYEIFPPMSATKNIPSWFYDTFLISNLLSSFSRLPILNSCSFFWFKLSISFIHFLPDHSRYQHSSHHQCCRSSFLFGINLSFREWHCYVFFFAGPGYTCIRGLSSSYPNLFNSALSSVLDIFSHKAICVKKGSKEKQMAHLKLDYLRSVYLKRDYLQDLDN